MQTAGSVMPAGVGAGDGFGTAVSMDGNNVMVGAPGTDIAAQDDAGAAYAFGFGGMSTQQLVSPNPLANAGFGQAVATAGGEFVAGAPGANGGELYRFGASFGLIQQITAPPGQSGFGAAVGGSELGFAVGAPQSNSGTGAATLLNDPDRLFLSGFE